MSFVLFLLCFLFRTIRLKMDLLEYQKQGSGGGIQKQQRGKSALITSLTWRLFWWRSCCWCAALRVRHHFTTGRLKEANACRCCYENSGLLMTWPCFQCSHSVASPALTETTTSASRRLNVQTPPTTVWLWRRVRRVHYWLFNTIVMLLGVLGSSVWHQ